MIHQPYTQQEHWKSFWRAFYQQKKVNRVIEIPLTDDMIKEAKQFCQQIVQEKAKEKHHQSDSNHEWKRWMTGVLGEMALESFLGASFKDTSVGESKNYAIPDLSPLGLEIGVKSFRVGNFPLVNRSKKDFHTGERKKLEGQIFMGVAEDRNVAYLLGLAFDEELYPNETNSENNRYVKDGNALKRKVAFTDFQSLHSFHSLSELTKLATEHDYLYLSNTQKIS